MGRKYGEHYVVVALYPSVSTIVSGFSVGSALIYIGSDSTD